MEKLNVDPNRMSKSQTLRLCIYFIEKKCDFNGEGVFLSSHTVEFNDEDSWHMEEIIKQSKIWLTQARKKMSIFRQKL